MGYLHTKDNSSVRFGKSILVVAFPITLQSIIINYTYKMRPMDRSIVSSFTLVSRPRRLGIEGPLELIPHNFRLFAICGPLL